MISTVLQCCVHMVPCSLWLLRAGQQGAGSVTAFVLYTQRGGPPH